MFIKFSCNDPLFEQKMELLKLQFRTTQNAVAARRAIEEFYEIERKLEISIGQLESMQYEIERLRELLEISKSTSISSRIAHIRSKRS